MPKTVTNEDFVKKLYEVNKNIKPLEEYRRCRDKIKFKCLIDGTIFESTPNNALRGHGCPLCGIRKGSVNATKTKISKSPSTLLGNKHPHLIPYLKNKDDAFLYGYTSKLPVDWICLECNYEFSKPPFNFYNGSIVCPNCIKNDSYPNRFMFDILTQLEIEFEREYSPDWIKPKRYDFYFCKDNIEYIIEMDGRLHINEDVQKNDKEKDDAANEHGIKIIRIDCDYINTNTRYQFIKSNILKSELSNILDLESINFDQSNAFALKNEVNHVCELWEKYKDLDEIQKDTKLTLYTIKKYLNFGQENNMCSYNHEQCMEDRKQKRIEEGKHGRSKMVMCDQTGEIFSNMKAAERKYHCNVSAFFYQNRGYAGQLSDGTKLTWTKIIKEVS